MWDLTWSERAWVFGAGFAATAISEGLAAPFPSPYAVAKKDLPRPTDTIRGRAEFYRHHMSLGKTSVFPGAALNGVEKAMRRAPHAATGFILNDTIREKVNTFHPRQEFGKSLLANVTSGAIAGLVTSALWIPFEIPRFAQTPEGFQQIKQGLYGPAGGCRLAAATTGGALYFGLFNQLQSVNPHGRDLGMIGLPGACINAVVASTAGCAVARPFLAIQRRMAVAEAGKYAGVLGGAKCFQEAVKEAGLLRAMWGSPAMPFLTCGRPATALVLYHVFKTMLEDWAPSE